MTTHDSDQLAEVQPDEAEPGTEPELELGTGPEPEAALDPLRGPDPEPNPRPEPVPLPVGSVPLQDVPAIGDAGAQPEIVAVPGPLTIGVPDTALDFFTLDPLEVRACSTRGHSHRYSGTPRQDTFCLLPDERWLVVAVADGVSASPYSQVAAEIAARVSCKLVLDACGDLDDVDWPAVSGKVSRRIIDEGRYRGLITAPTTDDANDQARVARDAMATTAVVAAVGREVEPEGLPVCVVVLAGDSGAYRLGASGIETLAGGKADDGSGLAVTSVHPLPGPSQPSVVKAHLSPGEALLLTSDGIGDAVGDGRGRVAEDLARRWAGPPTAADFFRDVNFFRRSYDDDRTVVAVWYRPAETED